VSTSKSPRNQNVNQAAVENGVSDEAIRRAIRQGAPHDRLGPRTLRVNAAEIRVWMLDRAAKAVGK